MSLKDKLEKYKQEQKKSDIDWNARKEEWKKQVNELFSKINEWLHEYVENDYMEKKSGTKKLQEEYIGEYEVPTLTYEIGPHSLHFDTLGRNVIGGKGRIDVYLKGYKSEKYLLVLLEDDDQNDYWVLVPFSDKTNRTKLDKESLEKLIESWIDKSTI
jgi:hypothetical protein